MMDENANATRICLEAFKYTDMGAFLIGQGKQQTGYTLSEWAYGQSPLATIIGICCLVLRFADTRMASFVAYAKNIKLRAYQKVPLFKQRKHKCDKIAFNVTK
jgi:hypothetical protein